MRLSLDLTSPEKCIPVCRLCFHIFWGLWYGTLPATFRRRHSLIIDHTSAVLFLTGQTDSTAAIFGLLYVPSGELFSFGYWFPNSTVVECGLRRSTLGNRAGGDSKSCSGTLEQRWGHSGAWILGP